MIFVLCNQPNESGWRGWHKRVSAKLRVWCKLANKGNSTVVVDEEGERSNSVKISNALYIERKEDILERFGGRCAYCESLIKADQPGDVEHYRPKGAVETLVLPASTAEAKQTLVRTTDHGEETLVRKTVEVKFANGSRGPHPGYYWLAYEWSNLLPACTACNRAQNRNGHFVGKEMVFAVEGDANALRPTAVKRRRPLLINPNEDDPSDDLELEGETGVLSPKRLADGTLSRRGTTTIALLDLNRTELVAQRKRAYEDFHEILSKLIRMRLDDPATVRTPGYQKADARFDEYEASRLPFMLALRTAHRDWLSTIHPVLFKLGFPKTPGPHPVSAHGAAGKRPARASNAGIRGQRRRRQGRPPISKHT